MLSLTKIAELTSCPKYKINININVRGIVPLFKEVNELITIIIKTIPLAPSSAVLKNRLFNVYF